MVADWAAIPFAWAFVAHIAKQRVAEMGHVQADLVGAPGDRVGPHKAAVRIAAQHLEFGAHLFDNRAIEQHLANVFGFVHAEHAVHGAPMAGGEVDFIFGYLPAGETDILLMNLVFEEAALDGGVDFGRFRDHEHAAGVAVEPVREVQFGRGIIALADVLAQHVEQVALRIPWRYIDVDISGFVEHQQVVVFVDDPSGIEAEVAVAATKRGLDGDAHAVLGDMVGILDACAVDPEATTDYQGFGDVRVVVLLGELFGDYVAHG